MAHGPRIAKPRLAAELRAGRHNGLETIRQSSNNSRMLKLYAYQGCSTCRNAVKWLKQHGVAFEEIAIREQPPTTLELKAALKSRGGDLGALFNRSGQDYRTLGMKDKLPAMSEAGALQLLSKSGNLVKRPFAIDEKKRVALVGFKETEWESALI